MGRNGSFEFMMFMYCVAELFTEDNMLIPEFPFQTTSCAAN